MKIEMIGLNHRSAGLSLRERAAVSPEALPDLLQRLVGHPNIEGAVVLSTCNRAELYLSPTYHFDEAELRGLYADACGLTDDEAQTAYVYRDSAAVNQLFRVTSGLDSQMLGEIQILAQVKTAYGTALELAGTNAILNKLFTHAIFCGKKVRTRTAISQGAVSVAYAAIELAQRLFRKLDEKNILLVGAGETTRLAAKYLADAGGANWRVSNRTQERASEFASTIGAQVASFPPAPEDLSWADIVVCATAAPGAVIQAEPAKAALRSRKRPLLFLDLAVPRDVDPELSRHDEVYLYTVDDFQELVAANIKSREKEAVRAEEIVEKEVAEFSEWYRQNRIAPSLQQLQSALESIRLTELENQAKHFRPEDLSELDKFSKSLMKKVTSLIVANMRRASTDGSDLTLARAIAVAFAGKDQQAIEEILEKLNHELSH
ncbi:MAG: glutamyl-tRNA reductase [Calditrichaeota bacterium]|nr:glutamyl-tRNA reductase [Calditrichota bacterium]MCB9365589.1 glutamyl-tRNA reductase [Calditrichota bacterium]